MSNTPTTIDELKSELLHLRRQNRTLQEQLAFHRKLLLEMRRSLENVPRTQGALPSIPPELSNFSEKVQRLTPREKQVLRLLTLGYTSREMADQLGISKLTVDTHRKNIQRKLEVTNTVSLLKVAMLLGD